MSIARRSVNPRAVLALVCGVQFMVTLDLAIVNVAIPSIQADLGLSQADLQWVVVAYGVTLGGFLLLGGRAGDLLGRRRMLVTGMALFAAASLAAAVSTALVPLVAARAAQGLGAALAAPAALSILVGTFAEGPDRTRALGLFAAVSGSGGTVGVIAGGVLTDGPGWEWIFLINLPIGALLVALAMRLLPRSVATERGSADVLGAATVTAGLMAIVYGVNKSVDRGWTDPRTLVLLAIGCALLALFVVIERRATMPLVPAMVFRQPTLAAATVVAALLFAAFFATIFETSLFMQQTLGYSAMKTGLAWLAATASSLVVAGAIAPRVVGRFGPSRALLVGELIVAAGLLVLAQAPADASYWVHLFPGLLAFGVGLGFSIMAAQVAAFIGVEDSVSGLAGGIVETAREVGGALGTAIVATVVIARTDDLLGSGSSTAIAATGGYHRGVLVAAGLSLAAAVAAVVVLRPAERKAEAGAEVVGASR